MFELDRTRQKTSVKSLKGQQFTMVHTNGRHCIMQDTDGEHWMSVPLSNKVDLYPMRAI